MHDISAYRINTLIDSQHLFIQTIAFINNNNNNVGNVLLFDLPLYV